MKTKTTPAAQAAHTPGDWRINGRRIEDRDGVIVCTVAGIMDEALANRRLIAAAPALREALEECVRAHDLKMGPRAKRLRIEISRAALERCK